MEERQKLDDTSKHYYETTMSEWLAVEAIVRQREKEKNAKAMAKISAENNRKGGANEKHMCRQTEMDADDLENDVFDDHDFSDISDPGIDFDDDLIGHIQEEKDSGNCDDEELVEEEMDSMLKEKQQNALNEQYMEREVEEAQNFKEDEVEEVKEVSEYDEVEEGEHGELEAEEALEVSETQEEIYDQEHNQRIEVEDATPEMEELHSPDEVFYNRENVVLEFDEIEPLPLNEHCFAESEPENGLTPDQGGMLLLSIKSSPSTSSYETVGNEFTDMIEMTANEHELEMEEEVATETAVAELSSQPDEIENPDEELATEAVEEDEVGGSSSRKYHSVEDMRSMSMDDMCTQPTHAVIITEAASIDALECTDEPTDETSRKTSLMSPMNEDITVVASLDALQEPKSACVSPASSNGGVYSVSYSLESCKKTISRDSFYPFLSVNFWKISL